jgi:HPt (histidine-containing phosphotransfer) domain-containing protein
VGSKGAGSGASKACIAHQSDSEKSASDAIDWEYFSRFTLGNTALEQEVLQLFAEQASLYLERLRTAKSTQEWADAAHTIKGSALAIGARRLASIADMAEHLDIAQSAGREGGGREQAIDAVAGALDEVCRCIQDAKPRG